MCWWVFEIVMMVTEYEFVHENVIDSQNPSYLKPMFSA